MVSFTENRAIVLVFLALLLSLASPADAEELDFDLSGGSGHFFKQANGQGGAGDTGYAVTNEGGVPFWEEVIS